MVDLCSSDSPAACKGACKFMRQIAIFLLVLTHLKASMRKLTVYTLTLWQASVRDSTVLQLRSSVAQSVPQNHTVSYISYADKAVGCCIGQ